LTTAFPYIKKAVGNSALRLPTAFALKSARRKKQSTQYSRNCKNNEDFLPTAYPPSALLFPCDLELFFSSSRPAFPYSILQFLVNPKITSLIFLAIFFMYVLEQ